MKNVRMKIIDIVGIVALHNLSIVSNLCLVSSSSLPPPFFAVTLIAEFAILVFIVT